MSEAAIHEPELESVHDLFLDVVRRTPDAEALIEGSRAYTYRELARRASVVATHLERMGVSAGDLVALVLPRGVDFAAAMLGICQAGCRTFPIDPAYPLRLRETLLERHRPRLTLTRESVASLVRPAADRQGLVDLPRLRRRELHLDPKAPAFVVLTSGTTGVPRAVERTHDNVVSVVRDALRSKGFDRGGFTTLMRSPVCHSGILWELFACLALGARIVVVPPGDERDPRRVLALIAEHRVAYLACTPGLMAELMRADASNRLASLEGINISGEVLPGTLKRTILDRFPGALGITYGCTEAAGLFTHRCSTSDPDFPIIGRPDPAVTVRVVDADGADVPAGAVGELLVGGPYVARGYLDDPDATRARFFDDPTTGARFFRTRDRVRRLDDGIFAYEGRIDRVVQIRGFRVDPQMTEGVMRDCPGVREAAVAALDLGPGRTILVGYLVAEGAAVAAVVGSVRQRLTERLPPAACPVRYVVLERLPRNLNGKIDYRALPAPPPVRPDWEVSPEAPAGSDEATLVAIFEEVLGISPIGRQDDFFAMGGDSLLAAAALELCRQRLGRSASMDALYQTPTVADLARRMRARERQSSASLSKLLNPDGTRTPAIFVHGLRSRHLEGRLSPDQPLLLFRHQARGGGRATLHTVEAIAEHHVAVLKRLWPTGPYRIGGFCSGSVIAFAMAHMLIAAGDEVERLVLVEPSQTLGRRVPGKSASAATSTGDDDGQDEGRRDAPAPALTERWRLPGDGRFTRHLRAMRSLDAAERWRYFQQRMSVELDRLVRRTRCRMHLLLSGRVPAELWQTYLFQLVYARAFPAYRVSPLPGALEIVLCEHGMHPDARAWDRLARGGVAVSRLEGARHMDALRAPWLDRWLERLIVAPTMTANRSMVASR